MKVLVAKKQENGSWVKQVIFHNARKDGSFPVPHKWQGSMESFVGKSGARFVKVWRERCRIYDRIKKKTLLDCGGCHTCKHRPKTPHSEKLAARTKRERYH